MSFRLLSVIFCSLTAATALANPLALYQRAYPSTVTTIDTQNVLIRQQPLNAIEATPTLFEQIAEPYAAHFHPPFNDAGRARNPLFFALMYGEDNAAVESQLTTIDWFGKSVKVTTINDVHLKLQSIQAALAQLPEAERKIAEGTAGTFNYRKIAGTDDLSSHAYGIAIDLAVEHANYWRWGRKADGSFDYQNRIPHAIVDIFEAHGFIWGGKWHHFDTMHFEYRPEILLTQ